MIFKKLKSVKKFVFFRQNTLFCGNFTFLNCYFPTMKKIGLLEITLLQVIFYLSFWIWNGFIALYVTICFSCICLLILLITLIAEWLDPSKVPRRFFFGLMSISIITPLLVGAIAVYIFKIPTMYVGEYGI